ncbi:MAG: isopeptide-forming domain-containing fimbrial protein [Firmicutes bacterium]|nr:isopeptide-forming domain-containing fimbrial protein [Bacillota bacterium]
MKKNLKRFLGAALAATMIMGMASFTVSYAEDTPAYTITLNNCVEGHTYTAYRIFEGNIGAGKDFGNIKWAEGLSSDVITALKTAYKVTDTDPAPADNYASAVASAIKTENDANALSQKLIDVLSGGSAISVNGTIGTLDNCAPGYYIIVDSKGSKKYNASIVEVVNNNLSVSPKLATTTSQKKVKDINDTTGDVSDWQDSADYDTGDAVPFQLKATLTSDLENYKSYRVQFNDNLSKGLKYNTDSLTVKIGSKTLVKDTDYSVKVGEYDETNGTEITVIVFDAKAAGAVAGSEIIVEYTATLDKEAAVVGSAGNPNELTVDYTTNYSYDAQGDKDHDGSDDDNDDDFDGDDDSEETAPDKVIVFTYKTVVNKSYEGDEPAVADRAEFELQKKVGESYVDISSDNYKITVDKATNTYTFSGLDDGDYKLVETKVPNGYNKMEDVLFTITATHDAESEDPALTTLTAAVTEKNVSVTNADAGTGAVTTNAGTCEVDLNIINTKGIILPTTGGMGTKVIYGAGGALVLAAGVLLVTKRRMRKEEE